ncbi:hypothetical protein HMPREF3185_01703 [Porphyromonas somerae]|uniref:Uncharacterized protein n=1 Tax=Porphyromonas somerae TaxID=322095 RepID=A0A134B3E0_9PORP|nr:hypothetical protein HMPREF3184_01703 [Porphyromonadaceae bacterium KA00676]KXB74450.1 hypothetical protein HMPREF3185_01703 [Porphyromonas somerae]
MLLSGVVRGGRKLPIPYYIYVRDDCVARCGMSKNAQEYEECAKYEYCA